MRVHRLSDLLALCKEVRHLWRKHKRASVVALDKLDDDLGRLFGLVFVQKVARGGEDVELKFACTMLAIMYAISC